MGLFSNKDDGDLGQTSGEPGYDPTAIDPKTGKPAPLIQPEWWRKVCWAARNPFHDWSFGDARKPGGWFVSVPLLGYIGHRPMPTEPERDGAFGAAPFRGYPNFWSFKVVLPKRDT